MKSILISEPNKTLKKFLVENKDIVYSAVLESINESYRDSSIDKIDILEISNNGEKSYMTLDRKNWIRALEQAINFFQMPDIEEYEKCSECLSIIDYLKNN
jgi:hypothetical protein